MTIEEIYKIFLSCTELSTDTRSIKGGELFLALKGENFDANDYALSALEKGASYAIISKKEVYDNVDNQEVKAKLILVEDSQKTLSDLATYHRLHIKDFNPSLTPQNKAEEILQKTGHIPIIAITGTNGKTTTKELINSVLSVKYKVCATKGNLNNDIGVPLTLLKIKKDDDIAIIEMGANHLEDITKLCEVAKPNFSLITNIGRAHLQGFGSLDGVKYAKSRIFEYIKNNGGEVFLNEDDENIISLQEELINCKINAYGLSTCNTKILPTDKDKPYLSLEKDNIKIKTNLIGSYNAINIVVALKIAEYFGISLTESKEAIENYIPKNNRSQLSNTQSNSLIIDAYNANPSSMSAALNNFIAIENDKKAICLGDMRELGAESLEEHIKIVQQLSDYEGIKIYLVGEEFIKAIEKLELDNKFKSFKTSEELANFFRNNPLQTHLILIKGSRGIEMEKIISAL